MKTAYVYKLVCKDPIVEAYNRKAKHKSTCNNENKTEARKAYPILFSYT